MEVAEQNDVSRRRVSALKTKIQSPQFRPVFFDVLLALFVGSAFIGTQTAYAPGPAWIKFLLIAGAWGLYYVLRLQPDFLHLYGVLAVGGFFGVAIAAFFFMAYDWSDAQVKIPVLTALGRLIAAPLPKLTVPGLNPNVIGGVLAMLLPGYVFLASFACKKMSLRLPRWLCRGLPIFWWSAVGSVLLTLLVTSSRGAWLATLIGFGLWGLWAWLGRRFTVSVQLRWLVGLCLSGVILVAIAAYTILAYDLPGAGALTNRINLLRSALPLARDYVLTGAGLDTFQMNFSIYTLLIHVGYIPNGHNVFVDLVVEQGVLGLTLYLSLVVFCVWQGLRALRHASRYPRWLIEVGLVSLVVTLIHGQVEDILYGSRWVGLFLVPFALVQRGVTWTDIPDAALLRPARRWVWGAVGALVIVGAVFWRPLLAQGYASLGAMRQARLELASYEFGQTPGFIMDLIRQEVDLTKSIALYEQAIAIDPGNATARQRLAGIYLSREAYDVALQHLEIAGAAGHYDSVTLLLLGDALFALGHVDEAAKVVAGLPWAEERMEGQAWSRYWERGDFARAAYAWRTVALLNPENAESALQRAREAEMRAME